MRCRNCKQKFEVKRFNQKYCDELECRTAEAMDNLKKIKTKQDKDWKKRKKEMKEDLKSLQDWYNEALEIFNTYIRLRDKDKPCVSCGAKAGTYTISSGHYFPQGNNRAIALDERNAHGQCWYNCNSSKSGNLSEYYPELINRIGQKGYEDLQRLRHQTKRYTVDELKDIKEYYKEKIKKNQ
jgi:ElaB/YqjD/DUF883 family membrane-anchored ribosome-binding protein